MRPSKKLLFVVISIFVLSSGFIALAQNTAPVVTNVVAQQIAGTGTVRITYDVTDADGDSMSASVICSSDNGVSFELFPKTVSGDVHRPMASGTGKEILWNAALDYPGRYWSQVIAKVIVSDGPSIAGQMVFIPAGNFTMGSNSGQFNEDPAHTVHLDSYYIDKYEVTNGEFQAFIDAGGYSTPAYWSAPGWAWRAANNLNQPYSWPNDSIHIGPSWPGFPIINISWYEAEAFANFAGKRLPTEAEWEKAARGNDARTYPWGEVLAVGRANWFGSGDPYESATTPVGFFDGRVHPNPAFQTLDSPSPYGTYDQSGNAAEWVQDFYSDDYYAQSPPSNPTGPGSGTDRVIRGGSHANSDSQLRTTFRSYSPASSVGFGFRCARTP